MAVLNIVLTVIIALAGLPIGILLGKITKEELKSGKKYFEWMQAIFLILAALAILYSYNIGLLVFIAVSILISILIIKGNPRAVISYLVFLFLFVLSLKNTNLLIIVSSLIFLYGLPTGSLIRHIGLIKYMKKEIENPTEKRKNLLKKIIYVAWVVMLEILAIPTVFMGSRSCGEFQINIIVPICPSSRKKHRDINGKITCLWKYHWSKGNFKIPKQFGIINWIKQYMTGSTNLKRFKEYEK